MEQIKRITITLLALFIAVFPFMGYCDFSYAEEENSPSWTYIESQNDQANKTITTAIIKAYLHGRGYGNIYTYPIEKAIVQYSYNGWDKLAKSKGYNGLSDLNNHIAYRYNQNGVLEFFLDDSSLEMLNYIYAAILDYYQIHENESKTIYNGQVFTDNDGNSCYVFVIVDTFLMNNQNTNNLFNSNIIQQGTSYKYTSEELALMYDNNQVPFFNIGDKTQSNGNAYTQTIYKTGNFYHFENYSYLAHTFKAPSSDSGFTYTDVSGSTIIWRKQNESTLHLGTYSYLVSNYNNSKNYYGHLSSTYTLPSSDNNSAVNASITAAQEGMNAGIVAAGKAAAISTGKEGADAIKDYLEDNDAGDDDVTVPVDDPTIPPSDPIVPSNPSGGPTFSIPIIGGFINANGTFNFNMPDTDTFAPNGFSISGLLQKFPFCIPLDIYAIIDLLDAEPITPRIQQNVDFGSFNYNVDIDLTQFNPIMVFWRKAMLILYIFGIIFITPYIVK